MRIPALLIGLVALSSCATMPTVYAPANGSDRGFSDQRIEADRFRVRFGSGSDMSLEETEDMALRRAAELTLDHGADWFLVVSRDHAGNDRDPVRLGGSVGHSVGSRRYSGTSVGLGLTFDASAGEKEATLEILIRSGTMPDDPNAYDARDVLSHMAGR